MNGYRPLLRLQLLSRFADLKPSAIKHNLNEKRYKTIGMIAAYLFLAGWLAYFMITIQNLLLDGLVAMGIPEMILSTAVTGAAIATLILGFFFIMSSLYFSRDAGFLAALPVKSHTLLSARLTQVWFGEMGFASIVILPAIILYGIRTGQSAAFYLRALPVWLLSPVLPMAIVTVISTLLIRLSSMWKRRDRIATVGGLIFFGAYMYLCMSMGSIMPNAMDTGAMTGIINTYKPMVESITNAFPPVVWAARALQGDLVSLFLYAAVSLGAMALVIYVMGFSYQKLSLIQSEVANAPIRKKLRGDVYRVKKGFTACCKQEWLRIVRTPTYAMNCLPSVIMPAFMILAMTISMKSAASGGIDLFAEMSKMNGGVVLAILCGLMCFMGGLNPACSSAVTREGKGHEFMVSLPLPSKTIVRAKLFVSYLLSIVGMLVGGIVLVVIMPSFIWYAIGAFVISSLFSFIACALGLANDVRKPSLNWLTETEAIKQKVNGMIGMLVGFAMLALLAVLSYFMLDGGASVGVYAGTLLALLTAGSVASMIVLDRTAEKKYRAEH